MSAKNKQRSEMSAKCRASPAAKDCEPLRIVSPTLSPVGDCPADDVKPIIQPSLPSVSKFSHSNTYYNHGRKGIYRRFSMCDWDSAYESNKQKADIERRHGQMTRSDCAGTIRLTDGAKMLQCASTKRLGDGAYKISFWKGELIMEMNLMEKEIMVLEDMRQLVQKVLEDVEADLLLSEQCLLERERRIGVDQTRDDVENHLSNEVVLMRLAIKHMHNMLTRIGIQLKLNRAAMNDLDIDARDKQHAQQIDERMHRLNVESIELQLHEGVEYKDNTVTSTKTWLKFTKENLCRCQSERQRSALVRAQAEKLLRKVALDIWNCVQEVNRKLAIRLMETRDAYHKLSQHAERVNREISDMVKNIEDVKQAIIDKERIMKVTHTRLEERLRRLGAERCYDETMTGLQYEVKSLKEGIIMLQEKQSNSEYALARLAKTLSILQNDIQVKVQSIHVDSERCGALRRRIHIEPCIGVTFAMPRCEYDCYRPLQC